MSVTKSARIFEAVAEGAIEADMGNPDQRDRQDRRLSGEEARQRERQRQGSGCGRRCKRRPQSVR